MLELNAIPWKDYITIGVATVGAVLGIMNTWNAISQRRVRLRVRPAHAIAVPIGQHMFCIEVVNLSGFAVTLTEVGFASSSRGINRGRRLAIVSPILIDGKGWPRRLESRESVSTYFDPVELFRHGEPVGKAYGVTACGEVAYGSSPALSQLRKAVATSQ